MAISNNYFDILAQIESNNRPYVKAPTSSGSGLFQFIKSTWTGLGGSWGSDSTKAFGGLTPSESEQVAMARKFTEQNAAYIGSRGYETNNANLYAAHFLGAGTATKVLGASDGASMQSLVPDAVAANPFLKKMTVADFKDWLVKKTGGSANDAGATFRDTGRG